MAYVFGDVVLVPFPYHRSVRHEETTGGDCFERSLQFQPTRSGDHGDHQQVRGTIGFAESILSDWQSAGLLKPSVLKPVFSTIQQTLVLRALGKLSVPDLRSLRAVMAQALD